MATFRGDPLTRQATAAASEVTAQDSARQVHSLQPTTSLRTEASIKSFEMLRIDEPLTGQAKASVLRSPVGRLVTSEVVGPGLARVSRWGVVVGVAVVEAGESGATPFWRLSNERLPLTAAGA